MRKKFLAPESGKRWCSRIQMLIQKIRIAPMRPICLQLFFLSQFEIPTVNIERFEACERNGLNKIGGFIMFFEVRPLEPRIFWRKHFVFVTISNKSGKFKWVEKTGIASGMPSWKCRGPEKWLTKAKSCPSPCKSGEWTLPNFRTRKKEGCAKRSGDKFRNTPSSMTVTILVWDSLN